jgi:hypothetical protein
MSADGQTWNANKHNEIGSDEDWLIEDPHV